MRKKNEFYSSKQMLHLHLIPSPVLHSTMPLFCVTYSV